MASTLALSRPSEKLGTHSTSVLGMARRITGGGQVKQLGLAPLDKPGASAKLSAVLKFRFAG
jgi:hypothetical protein